MISMLQCAILRSCESTRCCFFTEREIAMDVLVALTMVIMGVAFVVLGIRATRERE